jgi:hypothetical protein
MKFHFEILIGDRYESTDYLSDDKVHQSLLKMQKQDILKAETGDEYWEDIPDELFELLKTSIKTKNYDFTMARGHLWLNIEIQIDNESNS